MADGATTNEFYFPPERREFISVLLAGIVVGTGSVGLAWLLSQYALLPIFCKDSTAGVCTDPFAFSFNVFLVIVTLAAIGFFAKTRIFRPALVALPSLIILWSLPGALEGIYAQHFLLFVMYSILLSVAIYAVFYWLVRIRSFFAVLVAWLVLIFLLRWLLVS